MELLMVELKAASMADSSVECLVGPMVGSKAVRLVGRMVVEMAKLKAVSMGTQMAAWMAESSVGW